MSAHSKYAPSALTRISLALVVAWLCSTGQARALQPGIWQAVHWNNSVAAQGTLIVARDGRGWNAEITGETAPGLPSGGRMVFTFQRCGCALAVAYPFVGAGLSAHWYQGPNVDSGDVYASPVTLRHIARDTYAGSVYPLYDRMAFFLAVGEEKNGTAPAYLLNFERDLGNQWSVSGLRQNGSLLEVLGGPSSDGVIANGTVRTDGSVSLYFKERGGTYDFVHLPRNAPSSFYPRGRPHETYTYAPPPQLDDGWRVARVSDVGISRTAIEKFVQSLIDTPMDGPKSRQIHAFLLARHGKLVVEEYFYGMARDRPHDPRSASKSITATLFGAAMHAGYSISPATPVYQVMNGGSFPRDLDPLKRRLTVEALLTMSSGWDCDDHDEHSPGSEDNMGDNLHVTDWYAATLALKMVRPPGTQAIYCSIQPNMVGGVLARATRQSVPELFERLIARPMQISRYYIPMRGGDAYMGGGLRLLPRDDLKFPQLYLDGGVWNGRRIVSTAWTKAATSVHVRLKYFHDPMYGYLWWIKDFPYGGHTYRAFSMLGAGGQIFTAIPALDLVIGFLSGDYSHHVPNVLDDVPRYILPAVLSSGP